ncbi:MAG: M67 family metallopeptidase [Armatimonadota bacterium]
MDELDDEVSLEPHEALTGDGTCQPLVFIAQRVLDDMNNHAAEEPDHEIGGIMIGCVVEGDQPMVMVEAAIRGQHLTYTRGSVTFTHDTWGEINRIKDEQYPDKRIVGWYHSHPGFGLFLSNYDLFIHKSFFTAPWQVAFVTDPKAKTHGIFTWQNGDLAQDHDLRIMRTDAGKTEDKPVEAREQAPVTQVILTPTASAPQRDRSLTIALWMLSGIMGLLAALSLANFAGTTGLLKKVDAQTLRMETLQQDMQLLRSEAKPPAGPTPAVQPASPTPEPAGQPPAPDKAAPSAPQGQNPGAERPPNSP